VDLKEMIREDVEYIYKTKDRAILGPCEQRAFKMLGHYFTT
jgi:hypothetical protein